MTSIWAALVVLSLLLASLPLSTRPKSVLPFHTLGCIAPSDLVPSTTWLCKSLLPICSVVASLPEDHRSSQFRSHFFLNYQNRAFHPRAFRPHSCSLRPSESLLPSSQSRSFRHLPQQMCLPALDHIDRPCCGPGSSITLANPAQHRSCRLQAVAPSILVSWAAPSLSNSERSFRLLFFWVVPSAYTTAALSPVQDWP